MSNLGAVAGQRVDALLRNVELSLSATFYPLGFRLELATNSRDVVEAAAEAWGPFRAEFEGPPLELRVTVQEQGEAAPEPVFRAQGHLFSIVADRDNLAVFDPQSMFGFCCVSAKTAADHAGFRWHFLEALVYMMLAQRHVVPVHGACVARHGSGVLLCGVSGAGKSTLAYACARAGWTFIGDDTIMLLPESDDRVGIGKPHQARFRLDAPELFPELAGQAAGARPGGKMGMEVALGQLPQIRTASHCTIDTVVFLERGQGVPAHGEPMPAAEVLDRLLEEGPAYGDEVLARHEKAIRRITGMPAYRMRYDTLEEAVELLAKLTCREPQ
ncbi:Hpr(Ser) kinase/phosphatase [Candidatus Sulfopaludibacter sp. SbA4]|nr:Hpr(Ser) kinase/phosphatase [Candidatus Sulfopaludibacter sp. SbA4]